MQIGSNQNLLDITANTNVAYAHYLAAAKLVSQYHEQTRPCHDEKVDGEAFFITDDEPHYFWDFSRQVWRLAGDTTQLSQVWAKGLGIAYSWSHQVRLLGVQAGGTAPNKNKGTPCLCDEVLPH